MMNHSAALENTHACNCAHGTDDARCCINRARRKELVDAWVRDGKPLEVDALDTDARAWLGSLLANPQACGGDCNTCIETR